MFTDATAISSASFFCVDPGFDLALLFLCPSFNISYSSVLLVIKSFSAFVSEKVFISPFFFFWKVFFFFFGRKNSVLIVSPVNFKMLLSVCILNGAMSFLREWKLIAGKRAKIILQWLVSFKRAIIHIV